MFFIGFLMLGATSPAAAIPVEQCDEVEVVGHRGTNVGHTENTVGAIQEAIRGGADWAEIDVRRTSDHVWVVMHDASVNRTTRGKGKISGMSMAKVRRIKTNDGQRIPSLSEALGAVEPTTAKIQVEVKIDASNAALRNLRKTLRTAAMTERTVITSFKTGVLRRLHAIAPEVSTALISRKAVSPAKAKRYGDTVLVKLSGLSRSRIRAFHQNDITVSAWTADTGRDWKRLVRIGADSIITDKSSGLTNWCIAEAVAPT